MDLLNKIQTVLRAEPNDAQLDKYLSDVRDSLAGSSRQFISYQIAMIVAIVIYHLAVFGGGTSISFSGVQFTDTGLFRRVFLVVPAAFLAAGTTVGYLRKVQRECFDFLMISRYRVLAQTGLHELRLPSDYILGLFIMKEQGGPLGRVLAYSIALLGIAAFLIAPALYIVAESIANIRMYGFADLLCVFASVSAIVLSICSLMIIRLSGNIKTSVLAN